MNHHLWWVRASRPLQFLCGHLGLLYDPINRRIFGHHLWWVRASQPFQFVCIRIWPVYESIKRCILRVMTCAVYKLQGLYSPYACVFYRHCIFRHDLWWVRASRPLQLLCGHRGLAHDPINRRIFGHELWWVGASRPSQFL